MLPYRYPDYVGNKQTMLVIHTNKKLTSIVNVYVARPRTSEIESLFQLLKLDWTLNPKTTDELERMTKWNHLRRIHWHYIYTLLDDR